MLNIAGREVPDMASIIKKRKKGKDYYYAVQSARVDGKPRIVWQKYLGSVERIVEKLDQAAPPEPKEAILWEFGGVAALLGIAQRIGVEQIIDRYVPKRSQGATVGQYMLLAAINRALAPKSKVQIGDWYATTILKKLWRHKTETFSSQRFWDHMGALDQEAIAAIENEITGKVVKEFDVDLSVLCYDTTNFFTFIDTFNDRCELPQRGHSKAKRHDLRIVGLALMVSRAFHIPLLHRTYQGGINDVSQFGLIADDLVSAYRELSKKCENVTLVFDKGNLSEDNMLHLAEQNVGVVASLVSSHHKDLLAIPIQDYAPLEGTKLFGVRTHRTRKVVFGKERTIVLTFSETFFSQQVASLTAQLTKCVRKLDGLAKRLERWRTDKIKGRVPTVASVKKSVKRILAPSHMKDLIKVEVIEQKKNPPAIRFQTDMRALEELTATRMGKTILMSDNDHWSDEQVVQAYRGQAKIEDAFRDMNNHSFLRWQPMGHWTDQKIRVHAFYCVLAMTLTSLLRKTLHDAGIRMSTEKMLKTLSDIKEIAILYPEGKARPKITFSGMTPTQRKIANALSLDEFKKSR